MARSPRANDIIFCYTNFNSTTSAPDTIIWREVSESKVAKENVPQNVERYMTLAIADQAKEVRAAAK
jgi:hypothetical protein